MKHSILFCLCGILFHAIGLQAQDAQDASIKPGWLLTFHDEFDSENLDLDFWNTEDPWNKEHNNELQAYVANALEWRPDAIIGYVDGIEKFRTTDEVPQQEMYMIVNLAVGGDWPGSPDELTRFPCFLEVDYVRVYAKVNGWQVGVR